MTGAVRVEQVTQVDREAAADLLWSAAQESIPAVREWHAIKNGEDDGHRIVQGFARHRLAERERAAKVALPGEGGCARPREHEIRREIAAAIREPNDE